MAGQMVGMDPEHVRALATSMGTHGEALQQLGHRVSTQLRFSSWCGADADAARYNWDTVHMRTVLVAAEALRNSGMLLLEQVHQQLQTSEADGQSASLGGPQVPRGPGSLEALNAFLSDYNPKLLGVAGDFGGLMLDLMKGSPLPGVLLDAVGILSDAVSGDYNAAAYDVVGVALGLSALIPGVGLGVGIGVGVVAFGWSLLGDIAPGVKEDFGGFLVHGVENVGGFLADNAEKIAVGALALSPAAPLAATYLALTHADDLLPVAGAVVGELGEFAGDVGDAIGDVVQATTKAGSDIVNSGIETAKNIWNSIF